MKFNGKSDNRNNRTTNFKEAKADLDKDGKLSSYERARGMAIQKNEKSIMSLTKTEKEIIKSKFNEYKKMIYDTGAPREKVVEILQSEFGKNGYI